MLYHNNNDNTDLMPEDNALEVMSYIKKEYEEYTNDIETQSNWLRRNTEGISIVWKEIGWKAIKNVIQSDNEMMIKIISHRGYFHSAPDIRKSDWIQHTNLYMLCWIRQNDL